MFQIIQDLIGNAVVSSGVSYEALCAILISSLFVIMIIGLVAGQELAFVLGGAGIIIGVIAWGGSGLNIAATKIYDQMQSYSMVAIPMFVLMANFLTHSKVADGLFLSIRYLLGPLKGGLGLAVIVVSTIFAATTGIVGASVVTMGMLSMPILLKCGYDHRLAAGMVCAGGSLGILIPPSIMLVTMGSYAEVSVGKLFFAALIPGLLLAACYAIYIIIICHIHPEYGPAMSEEELAEMPLKQRIVGSLVNLIPPLLLILGVLGSIFSGIATPTEAAGVGALVALILAICYKQFSWKMLYDSVIDTAKTSAMVFIILFGAAAFTGIFMSLDGDVIHHELRDESGCRQTWCFGHHADSGVHHGYVHRLDRYRNDCSAHFLTNHGQFRRRPLVVGRRDRCYPADLLYDPAFRLRTVLHQGHCAPGGKNFRDIQGRNSFHSDYPFCDRSLHRIPPARYGPA